MKIYTEINYKWLDGGLVETDSKSFEYEGDLTLCGPGGGGGTLAEVATKLSDDTGLTNLVETGANLGDTVSANIEAGAGAITGGVTEVLSDTSASMEEMYGSENNPLQQQLPTAYVPTEGYDKYGMKIVEAVSGGLGDLPSQVDQALTDPLGSATTGLGNLGENVGELGTTLGEASGNLTELGGLTELAATGTSNLLENLEITNLGSTLNEGMNTLGENVGLGGSTLDALETTGGNMDALFENVNEAMWALTDAAVTNIEYGMGYVSDAQQALAEKLYGTQDPKVIVDPDKNKAVKRGLKNKSRANLRVNKSKGRARSSLRVS